MLSRHHRDDVLHARGISDEVIDGAGDPPRYVSYSSTKDVKAFTARPGYSNGDLRGYGHHFKTGPGIALIRRGIRDYERLDPQSILAQRTGEVFRPVPRPRPYLRPDRPLDGSNKYVQLPGPRDETVDLDVHPMARAAIKRATRPFFFALEGSLKADAILSVDPKRIPVFSVQSVTMWKAAEDLADIGPYLKAAPPIFAVTDSDWSDPNKDVFLHATRCVAYFRENFNDMTFHVAPPNQAGLPKIGVDDFLAAGGDLNDLLVIEALKGIPVGLRKTEIRVLEWLLRLDGNTFWPWQIAHDLKIDRHTVLEAINGLKEFGLQVAPSRATLDALGPRVRSPHRFIPPTRQASLRDLGVDVLANRVSLGGLARWRDEAKIPPASLGEARTAASFDPPAPKGREPFEAFQARVRAAGPRGAAAVCSFCGGPLPVGSTAVRKCCSRRCAQKARRLRQRAGADLVTLARIIAMGKTQYTRDLRAKAFES